MGEGALQHRALPSKPPRSVLNPPVCCTQASISCLPRRPAEPRSACGTYMSVEKPLHSQGLRFYSCEMGMEEAPALFPEKIRCSGSGMGKVLWTVRSGRPQFMRTHWALALLMTKEDSEVGVLEHTAHGAGGTEVCGRCKTWTPPPPPQAEPELQ